MASSTGDSQQTPLGVPILQSSDPQGNKPIIVCNRTGTNRSANAIHPGKKQTLRFGSSSIHLPQQSLWSGDKVEVSAAEVKNCPYPGYISIMRQGWRFNIFGCWGLDELQHKKSPIISDLPQRLHVGLERMRTTRHDWYWQDVCFAGGRRL